MLRMDAAHTVSELLDGFSHLRGLIVLGLSTEKYGLLPPHWTSPSRPAPLLLDHHHLERLTVSW